MARKVHEFEGELEAFKASHTGCVKGEDLATKVEFAISSLMPALRKSIEDMAVKVCGTELLLHATASLPAEQRPADGPP